MNWVTTNLRIPEDTYMELKLKAARERKSVAAVIREKLVVENKQLKADNVLEMLKSLGREIAKENKGLDLTKDLIEMRYEQ